ncbi:MAG: RDD family protein [archaeon]
MDGVDLRLPKERKMLSKATVWKRFAAFFIDIMIVQMIVISPLSGIIEDRFKISSDWQETYKMLSSSPELLNSMVPIVAAAFFLIFAYFVAFEFKLSQTIGKMIFGIFVVPRDREKLSLVKAAIRNVAIIPFFPFTLLWIIDPLYLIFTGDRLSDQISQTMVIEEVKI